ncbi:MULTISPECIES: DUF1146 family protein [Enterococcaceae]|uniref:DUF1146 family protein n=1 Tax=Enterococcaceae TaxID=81852 RepID=UPI000E4981DF|nr:MULTISPECIES: DUF1146 family protein [Enterococcaceae]MCI0129572.1 DUF1146 family protein [Vagococcus sp. CY53-2]RGI31739.1 DUF1146 domain-containing protein [Melissococcus sp. OM08-11BH]UNM90219.1 DUF1146 family protein [Vagococcus sp. CY52-2]
MSVFGIDALVRILSHFIFIYLTFWTLNSLRLDVLFKKGVQYDRQIRLAYVFLSVAIGFQVSNFFLEVIFLVRNFFEGMVL